MTAKGNDAFLSVLWNSSCTNKNCTGLFVHLFALLEFHLRFLRAVFHESSSHGSHLYLCRWCFCITLEMKRNRIVVWIFSRSQKLASSRSLVWKFSAPNWIISRKFWNKPKKRYSKTAILYSEKKVEKSKRRQQKKALLKISMLSNEIKNKQKKTKCEQKITHMLNTWWFSKNSREETQFYGLRCGDNRS